MIKIHYRCMELSKDQLTVKLFVTVRGPDTSGCFVKISMSLFITEVWGEGRGGGFSAPCPITHGSWSPLPQRQHRTRGTVQVSRVVFTGAYRFKCKLGGREVKGQGGKENKSTGWDGGRGAESWRID